VKEDRDFAAPYLRGVRQPGATHEVSKNASQTQPARLLALIFAMNLCAATMDIAIAGTTIPKGAPLTLVLPKTQDCAVAELATAGLDTIAVSVSEDPETVEDVYEPFLMQLGFLARTPRGRVATKLAYDHLGLVKASSGEQPRLF